ncbi:MAG: HAMP domain-containing sensor histidine kinase [Gemmatimonadota bacterium]
MHTNEVVEEWLTRMSVSDAPEPHSSSLIEVYRTLGTALVERALASECDGIPGALADDTRVEPMVAALAATIRTTDFGIAQTLDDFADLQRVVADQLATDGGEQAAGALRLRLDVACAMDRMSRRLVRVLEVSAARASRERAEALAAMTEVLVHELTNRLGAASTAGEMLLTPNLDMDRDRVTRVARIIRASVSDAFLTVDDMKTLAGAGPSKIGMRSMELAHLVRVVIGELQARALDAGVALRVEGGFPDCLVDAGRLYVILVNLIANGIEHRSPTQEGAWVRVSGEWMEDGCVKLSVADNAAGIPPDQLEDIFLHRVPEQRLAPGRRGAGLGLVIAQEIARQLYGELSVSSDVDGGSRFSLAFRPVGPPDRPPS